MWEGTHRTLRSRSSAPLFASRRSEDALAPGPEHMANPGANKRRFPTEPEDDSLFVHTQLGGDDGGQSGTPLVSPSVGELGATQCSADYLSLLRVATSAASSDGGQTPPGEDGQTPPGKMKPIGRPPALTVDTSVFEVPSCLLRPPSARLPPSFRPPSALLLCAALPPPSSRPPPATRLAPLSSPTHNLHALTPRPSSRHPPAATLLPSCRRPGARAHRSQDARQHALAAAHRDARDGVCRRPRRNHGAPLCGASCQCAGDRPRPHPRPRPRP